MFLTVKEASDLTGKSATTIYRLCNKRRNSLYIKKEDNKFFIDKEFLLATYPPEEKRISEIIEHGSKEMGEPVFLEIEPKLNEKQVVDQVNNDIDNEADNTEEPIDLTLKNVAIETNPDLNIEQPTDNQAVESPQSSIPNENSDLQKVPFYHQREFWERSIGLSVMVLALVILLVLFYFNVN